MRKISTIILTVSILLGYCQWFNVKQTYAKIHSNTLTSEYSSCFKEAPHEYDCFFNKNTTNQVFFVTPSDPLSKIKSVNNIHSDQTTINTNNIPPFLVFRINSPPDHILALKTVQHLK